MRKIAAFSPELSAADIVERVCGGSVAAYEKNLRITLKLMPGNISDLNEALKTDLSAYRVKAHGIKGALNNIGAYALAGKAAILEKQALTGKIDETLHAELADAAKDFGERLAAALEDEADDSRLLTQAEILRHLSRLLPEAEKAVSDYDASLALKLLSPLYGAVPADGETQLLIDALERFDCGKAEEHINNLKNTLGEGRL